MAPWWPCMCWGCSKFHFEHFSSLTYWWLLRTSSVYSNNKNNIPPNVTLRGLGVTTLTCPFFYPQILFSPTAFCKHHHLAHSFYHLNWSLMRTPPGIDFHQLIRQQYEMKKRDKIFKKSTFHFIVQFNPQVLYTVVTAGLHCITMYNDWVRRWDDYCFSTFVMTHSSCWPWWSSCPELGCVFSCR